MSHPIKILSNSNFNQSIKLAIIFYLHLNNQKKKFQKASFPQGFLFNDLFQELNSQQTTGFLTTLSNIQNLVSDPQLFGAGLHQSIRGAFLDVHVDFNIHPQTKFYRRLNLLIFLIFISLIT